MITRGVSLLSARFVIALVTIRGNAVSMPAAFVHQSADNQLEAARPENADEGDEGE